MSNLSKKVCLLGDFAVGKTSLVRRFVYNLFDDKYISTIGVKVSSKTVVVPRNGDVVDLTIMLWDLAGGEEFDMMRASYLRGAVGAVLVCDLTRPKTLESLERYAEEMRSVNPNAQFIIAANKQDLIDQMQLSPTQIASVAAKFNAPYYLTSAKNGAEIETLFRYLGGLLVAQ